MEPAEHADSAHWKPTCMAFIVGNLKPAALSQRYTMRAHFFCAAGAVDAAKHHHECLARLRNAHARTRAALVDRRHGYRHWQFAQR